MQVLLTRHPDPPVRLCDLLKRKADEGVKIFVLIYREVSETLQKKHRTAAIQAELQELHPTNIRVLRHPLHFSTGQYFWSHHDKIVVVDQQIAFCGGIDLTEGRVALQRNLANNHCLSSHLPPTELPTHRTPNRSIARPLNRPPLATITNPAMADLCTFRRPLRRLSAPSERCGVRHMRHNGHQELRARGRKRGRRRTFRR